MTPPFSHTLSPNQSPQCIQSVNLTSLLYHHHRSHNRQEVWFWTHQGSLSNIQAAVRRPASAGQVRGASRWWRLAERDVGYQVGHVHTVGKYGLLLMMVDFLQVAMVLCMVDERCDVFFAVWCAAPCHSQRYKPFILSCSVSIYILSAIPFVIVATLSQSI